jgi:antitoxin HicB
MEKDLNYYMNLPYTIILEERDDGRGRYVAARIKELPGCLSHGDTPEEAVRDIQDAKREWLESNMEDGLPIPEPQTYTGQFHLRITPALHKSLAQMAELENTSLNHDLATLLARAIGVEEGKQMKERSRIKSK